jgi:hypothetical protein
MMLFQDRELKAGDVLESKRHGKFMVALVDQRGHQFYSSVVVWDCVGRLIGDEDDGISATWPDQPAKPETTPDLMARLVAAYEASMKPDREAEYRRIWIECAMRVYITPTERSRDGMPAGPAFDQARDFVEELRKRDTDSA